MSKAPAGWPKTLGALRGRQVRTRRDMTNGYMAIPAGTVMTVGRSSRWDGLGLRAPKCEHCGISPFISGVSTRDLELLPVEDGARPDHT